MEVLGDDYAIIQQLEDELRREGTQAEVVMGDLRLERDRNKQVTAVWVRWDGQDHPLSSPARTTGTTCWSAAGGRCSSVTGCRGACHRRAR